MSLGPHAKVSMQITHALVCAAKLFKQDSLGSAKAHGKSVTLFFRTRGRPGSPHGRSHDRTVHETGAFTRPAPSQISAPEGRKKPVLSWPCQCKYTI